MSRIGKKPIDIPSGVPLKDLRVPNLFLSEMKLKFHRKKTKSSLNKIQMTEKQALFTVYSELLLQML